MKISYFCPHETPSLETNSVNLNPESYLDKNIMYKYLLFSLGLCFPFLVKAQIENDSIRMLFIGNSYTFYNNMPVMVQSTASSQGVKLACSKTTVGGYTLRKHLSNEQTLQAVKQGGWNYVVIQEQSELPSLYTEKVIAKVYSAARSMDSLVRLYNKNVHIIWYMTWGRKDGSTKYGKSYPLVSTYAGMQQRLKTSYLELSYLLDGWCAPVGMAWERVRQEMPNCELYQKDKSHPTKAGSFLASQVFYTLLMRESFPVKYTAGLPEKEARELSRIAQETVLDNLTLLNVSSEAMTTDRPPHASK